MLAWMVYVAEVTLLLGIAAVCAERAARARRGSSRWIWLASIVASLAVPASISFVSFEVPTLGPPTAVTKVIPLKSVTSSALSPAIWISQRVGHPSAERSVDSLIAEIWGVTSLLLSAGLAASALHLSWRKRAWRTATLCGADVYVARDTGPAVVGLLRSKIVVPEWIARAPVSRQAMVIAHERSHVEGGDQKLLAIALCLLVCMPWNLPLWWQVRRLRHAIEVDCDARVLSHGHDRAAYGKALLEVGERRSAFVGAVAAMSEPVSSLERRIRIMMSEPAPWRRISAAALVLLSLGVVTVAAQVAPPNAATGAGENREITLPQNVLERYVGTYQMAPGALFTVTRNQSQLTVQLTGQSSVEIYPKSETSFFLKVVEASIDFVPNAQGPATALVLHQNGRDVTAPRIDAATAQQINSNLAARVQSQTAAPGSEAALRKLIEGIRSGMPDYAAMSSQLAEATRQQLSGLQSAISAAGAVQSVEFRGVGPQGADQYRVSHERATMLWFIALAPDGKIAGAVVRPE